MDKKQDSTSKKTKTSNRPKKPKVPSMFASIAQLLRPYRSLLAVSIVLIVLSNGLNLLIPTLFGRYIDMYSQESGILTRNSYLLLGGLVVSVFVVAVFQTYFTIYFSEKIARDLRASLVWKLSKSSYSYVNKVGTSDIITLLSSDVNNTKTIASQGIVAVLSALILLFGSMILMLITNWYLALFALSILPVIIVTFVLIFRRVGPLFGAAQGNLSKINLVISENIFGASLVRVLRSQAWEEKKFDKVISNAMTIGNSIISLFSLLLPSINVVSNLTIVLIIYIGGRQIIDGNLTIGQFTSFITYFNLLILPIFILGFTSQSFSRGIISYTRIKAVLESDEEEIMGNHQATIVGDIEVKDLTLEFAGRKVLDTINFKIEAGSRTAIIGPTGAGKSQLFSLLTGLNHPTSGQILIDGISLREWDKASFLGQVGLVFQDSLIFNGTLRDNIAFSNMVTDGALENAIYASKLDEFVESLETGLDTRVSERGASLSGGQKQRLMLARSLAVNPKILLLDDFTARVDNQTETQIWSRLKSKFPDVTLISITQQIESVKDFDKIIVLMEGELVGIGTHEQLLQDNQEYQQIYSSQQII